MIDEFYLKMYKETITLKDSTVKRRYMDGTILKTHKMFRMVIQQTVDRDIIPKNYVDDAKPPADDKRKIKWWDVNTINEFLEYSKDEIIYLPTFIAYHTGMREGKIAALRIEGDIDFKKGIIFINHNMVEKSRIRLDLEAPKIEPSKDIVVMTSELTKKLKEVKRDIKKIK